MLKLLSDLRKIIISFLSSFRHILEWIKDSFRQARQMNGSLWLVNRNINKMKRSFYLWAIYLFQVVYYQSIQNLIAIYREISCKIKSFYMQRNAQRSAFYAFGCHHCNCRCCERNSNLPHTSLTSVNNPMIYFGVEYFVLTCNLFHKACARDLFHLGNNTVFLSEKILILLNQ